MVIGLSLIEPQGFHWNARSQGVPFHCPWVGLRYSNRFLIQALYLKALPWSDKIALLAFLCRFSGQPKAFVPKDPIANDIAQNPYYGRDFRRNYPRLAVYSQEEVAGLIAAKEALA